jgi:hypothetical protein
MYGFFLLNYTGLRHELSDLFYKFITWISSKYSSATDLTGWSFIAHDLLGLFRLLRSLHELNEGSELLVALKANGKKISHLDSVDPHDSFMTVTLIMSFVSPINSQCLSLCSDMVAKGRNDATQHQ